MNWSQWAKLYGQRHRRERLVLFLLGPILLLVLFDTFGFSRQRQELQRQVLASAELQTQQRTLNATIEQLKAHLTQDPDAELKQQLLHVDTRLSSGQQEMRLLQAQLISPSLMAQVLQKTLVARSGVQLIRVLKLPSEPLPKASAHTAEAAEPTKVAPVPPVLYLHPLQLELSGDFAAIQAYLTALEQLPWRFYWRRLDYRVTQYPEARVLLEIYTLGSTEDWLSV